MQHAGNWVGGWYAAQLAEMKSEGPAALVRWGRKESRNGQAAGVEGTCARDVLLLCKGQAGKVEGTRGTVLSVLVVKVDEN